jgi:hypothetical protein
MVPMVIAAFANSLWCLSGGPTCAAFISALRDPDAAQQQVLRELLRKNAGTAFGREHGLPGLRSAQEFARQVPIRGYDELQPWIDRIRRGQPQVLSGDPVRRLVPTSGSTAARKLIPYTAAMHQQLNQAIGPWIFNLYRRHPRALAGVSYWSVSPVAGEPFQSNDQSSCVPIGFDDDTEYLGGLRKVFVNAAMAVPPEVRYIQSMEDWRYVTALLLLRRANLSLISVWHPSFLTLLLREIETHWDQLLSDITEGSCTVGHCLPPSVAPTIASRRAPRRAKYLRNVSPARADHLWPKLQIVSCWADAHAAGASAELARFLGTVAIQPKGLIATEGIVSIPFEGHHPIAIRSHYFEFEDDAGMVCGPSALQKDHEYSVIMTTAGGLYRYRLDDRIAVDGFLCRTPSIRFVGKCAQVSDRTGEKLSDGFVASVFAKLFQGAETKPSFAMLAPDTDPGGYRYTLYLSADVSNKLSAELDALLSLNPHYAYCRRLSQLNPPRLFRVAEDAHAAYCRRLQRMGKQLGEIKPVGLSPLDDWSHQLSGHYLD